ncbi:MAG TPA: thiamine phosphate synthase [Longimicrobiales bacterium]|nr:thiamine phosphate synthase [Longimicrobiales bacterium]
MRRPDLRLIVITDRIMAAPRDLLTVVRQSLQGGAPAIQLRDKNAHARALLEQAEVLRALTDEFGALLFINDRLDVALAARADGVHLGPDDIPLHAVRGAVPAEFLIGISTDDPAEARAAQRAGADYIGCGAVFGTTSKADVAGEAIGSARLAEVVNAVEIPVVGIGGIDTSNVAEVAAAGAAGAAVIGAVMKAQEPEAAVRALLQPFVVRT